MLGASLQGITMSTTEPQQVEWISVEERLPPVEDWLLDRSGKVLAATTECAEGMTFAYCRMDEEDGPQWVTACASSFTLKQVTHWALRPALPGQPRA